MSDADNNNRSPGGGVWMRGFGKGWVPFEPTPSPQVQPSFNPFPWLSSPRTAPRMWDWQLLPVPKQPNAPSVPYPGVDPNPPPQSDPWNQPPPHPRTSIEPLQDAPTNWLLSYFNQNLANQDNAQPPAVEEAASDEAPEQQVPERRLGRRTYRA